jgi:hypothetical protein
VVGAAIVLIKIRKFIRDKQKELLAVELVRKKTLRAVRLGDVVDIVANFMRGLQKSLKVSETFRL